MRTRSRLAVSQLVIVGLLGAVAACGEDLANLTDAVSLTCPKPGALPFRLMTSGFQNSSNDGISKANPRIKDEASDSLGNPGGVVASIYLGDQQAPTAQLEYRGAKARTTHTGGLFSKPLSDEFVTVERYDDAAGEWQAVGRTKTDADGYYTLDASVVAPNGVPLYAMLEADGTCAEHHDYLLPPGSKFVVADIDGTLTLSDEELIMQVADDNYTPAMMGAADVLLQTWATKGYPIVYLTARPHVFRSESVGWLEAKGFPPGPVITSNGGSAGADVYKTIWLERMIASFGWVPVAAYGNASTDITAYANAGIPGNRTFIVGGLGGGTSGTVAIPNNDFTAHITSYVAAQPANQ